uniref:Actin-related protein 4 n=1 Tax=Leptobrachium leishanense TaxID=445787 RepID=A0A8C5QT07_9ANUR
YMVASKESVREEEPAIWQSTERVPPVTRSWHNYMCNGVISDFKASVLRVSSTLYNEKHLPDAQYEFPNGYNCSFGTERLRITEGLFDPSTVKGLTDKAAHGVCETVMKSISLCDPGIRKALYSSVVLTGGNTLLEGYRDRLIRELPQKIPQDMKLKVFAKQNPVERRANAWFGGATFAALGAFQQMCISKQEYDEEGSQCLERKCP